MLALALPLLGFLAGLVALAGLAAAAPASYDNGGTPGDPSDDVVGVKPPVQPGPATEPWLLLHHQGDAQVRVHYDDRATPAAPGDDEVRLEQNVDGIGVHADARRALPGAGPLPAASASLREVRVEHDLVRVARAVDDGVVDPLAPPLDLEFDERGYGPRWHLPGAEWDGRRDDWPRQGWYGLPFYADDDEVGLASGAAGNTDDALALLDAAYAYHCTAPGRNSDYEPGSPGDTASGLAEHFVLGPACALRPGEAAKPLLLSAVLHAELLRLDVFLRAHGIDAAVLAGTRAGASPHESGLRATVGAPPGEDEPLSLGGEAAPAEPLNPKAHGPAPSVAPRSSAPALSAGSPLAGPLAALALLALGLAVLAVPLYRRLVQERVASQETRARILEFVRASPGVHEAAVAKALALSTTLAQYHVRMLAEFGMLEVRRFGGRKCLFVAGQVGRVEKALLFAERGRGAEILAFVARQPGLAQCELARALGMGESSVKWHLDRLEGHGLLLVERTPEGKRVRLSPEAERARLAAGAGAAATRVPGGRAPPAQAPAPPALAPA